MVWGVEWCCYFFVLYEGYCVAVVNLCVNVKFFVINVKIIIIEVTSTRYHHNI